MNYISILFNFTDLPQPVHVTGAVANNGTHVPTSVVETMQGRMVIMVRTL